MNMNERNWALVDMHGALGDNPSCLEAGSRKIRESQDEQVAEAPSKKGQLQHLLG